MDAREVFVQKVASVTSSVLMLASGIGSILYLTNKLGVSAYGEYASLIAIALIIRFPFESFFLSAIPLMTIDKNPAKLGSAILRAMGWVGAILTLISASIGLLAPQWLRISSPAMWCAISCDILCALIANGYLTILIGKTRFLAASIIYGVFWIARFGLSVAFVELGYGTIGALAAIPVASFLQFFLCAVVDRGKTLFSSRISWKELWSKSKIYSLSMILERMLYSCDLVAMKLFDANPLAIGYYATGLSLSQAFLAIARSLSSIQMQMLVHYRNSNQSVKFDSLAQFMLISNIRMIGLAIVGLPYLPTVIQLLLGRDITSTHSVFALIIAAASLQLLFSSGRILNVATGDPSQMKLLLFVALVLQSIGFGVAAQLGSSFVLDASELAIFQAKCCAVVSIASNLGLALYALHRGLVMSNQAFPWGPAFRILGISTLLACLGVIAIDRGVSALWLIPLSVLGYFASLVLTKDFHWSENSLAAQRQ